MRKLYANGVVVFVIAMSNEAISFYGYSVCLAGLVAPKLDLIFRLFRRMNGRWSWQQEEQQQQ